MGLPHTAVMTSEPDRPAMHVRAARTRAAVLEAGIDLLRSEGWQAITHQRIAAAAGVGRASVYRHWPDPDEMLLDVMGHALAREARPVEHSGDLVTDLRAELRALGDAVNDGPTIDVVATLIERALTDPRHRAFHGQMTALARAGVLRVVARAIDDGLLDPELDAATAAAQTLGPLVYRRLLVPAAITDDDVDAIVDAFVRAYGVER